MLVNNVSVVRLFLLATVTLLLAACGGGGGTGSTAEILAAPEPPPPAMESPAISAADASRFLSQATFGPTQDSIATLVEGGLEAWLIAELEKPPTLQLDAVLDALPDDGSFLDAQDNPLPDVFFAASDSFWKTAIEADDQLRQRMAFALSQILVVSGNSNVGRAPQMLAAYMDALSTGALGNYRDLLQNVTYSPAMAVYLTYLRNQKADPATGRVPDENYARELMQLFSIGLVQLNQDGSPVEDSTGQVELFDNTDITGLAKVFTGLSFSGTGFNTGLRFLPLTAYYSPLTMFNAFHSHEEKSFLDTTIPANTDGETSIDMALDTLFAHPNVGPFIGRQLIQRFVTSHPSPGYVSRVAQAFDSGAFTLESGALIGSEARGDLAATIAAILFDAEARDPESSTDTSYGKLREPVLRFTHWARAFGVNGAEASNEAVLRDTSSPELLGQHPYRSPSVFNFYRPGYIAPGTETGNAGLTVPELQISNAATIIGYPNFMTIFALGLTPKRNPDATSGFEADYTTEAILASDTAALLDHLDILLTHGSLLQETRERITQVLDHIDAGSEQGAQARARLASILVMTSAEYIVLR